MIHSKHFFHFFSLDQFSHLQSLTLVDVRKNNVEKLKSILQLIPKLCCFRLINLDCEVEEIINALPTYKLKTLDIQKMILNLTLIHRASSIHFHIVF